MAKDKVNKVSLEEEFNILKKHFGGFIATVKALKETVDTLQKKLASKETDGIQEILDKQKAVEEGIATNANALKRIDGELEKLTKMEKEASQNTSEHVHGDVKDMVPHKKKPKKCRYFDRGYCKYKTKCRFTHMLGLCSQYLQIGKCERKECDQRHVGCKHSWEERKNVKSHIILNMEVFFCLNCDDWIQEKAAVFNDGWTMFDETGALRYDI